MSAALRLRLTDDDGAVTVYDVTDLIRDGTHARYVLGRCVGPYNAPWLPPGGHLPLFCTRCLCGAMQHRLCFGGAAAP